MFKNLWGSKPYREESNYSFSPPPEKPNVSSADSPPSTAASGVTTPTSPHITTEAKAILSSVFSTLATKITTVTTVMENNLLGGEEKKQLPPPEKILPPCMDLPTKDEKIIQEVQLQIKNLTKSRRNFLNAPPEDATFKFEFNDHIINLAEESLKADPFLAGARFTLVPKYIKEPQFWRNYFYRVHMIKEAYGLNTIEQPPTTISIKEPKPLIVETTTVSQEQTAKTTEEENQSQEEIMTTTERDFEFVSDFEAEMKSELENFEGEKTTSPDVEIDAEWEEQMKKELEEDTKSS